MNISVTHARHFLKHAIDHTGVEVHMPVQAGAVPVDKGYRANVQRRLVHLGCMPIRSGLSGPLHPGRQAVAH